MATTISSSFNPLDPYAAAEKLDEADKSKPALSPAAKAAAWRKFQQSEPELSTLAHELQQAKSARFKDLLEVPEPLAPVSIWATIGAELPPPATWHIKSLNAQFAHLSKSIELKRQAKERAERQLRVKLLLQHRKEAKDKKAAQLAQAQKIAPQVANYFSQNVGPSNDELVASIAARLAALSTKG